MNHSFDIEIAKEYGVDEAIMINNFQFWIMKNKANGKHEYDGKTWTYNTAKALSLLFPYWSSKQCTRVINNLVDNGVLLLGHYSINSYDRTNWYAFNAEEKFLYNDFPKSGNGNVEIGKSSITDINTDTPPAADVKPKEEVCSNTAIVETIFKENGSTYDFAIKERANAKKLSSEKLLKDPIFFLQMVKTFRSLTLTDKFFKTVPFTPSMLLCHWEKIKITTVKNCPAKTVQPVCSLEEQMTAVRHNLRLTIREPEMTDDEVTDALTDLRFCKTQWGAKWRDHISATTKGWLI